MIHCKSFATEPIKRTVRKANAKIKGRFYYEFTRVSFSLSKQAGARVANKRRNLSGRYSLPVPAATGQLMAFRDMLTTGMGQRRFAEGGPLFKKLRTG
jgi:hypothetical protein